LEWHVNSTDAATKKKPANVFTQSNKIATFIVKHSQLEKAFFEAKLII
jgi:hypothetical protein